MEHVLKITMISADWFPRFFRTSSAPTNSCLARLDYLLTNWLAHLYERMQSPKPDVMPDQSSRAVGFGCARINTQASE